MFILWLTKKYWLRLTQPNVKIMLMAWSADHMMMITVRLWQWVESLVSCIEQSSVTSQVKLPRAGLSSKTMIDDQGQCQAGTLCLHHSTRKHSALCPQEAVSCVLQPLGTRGSADDSECPLPKI